MDKDSSKSSVEARQMSKLLLAANRINFKAHKCETLESLIFLILNDTIEVARYDRALLWDMTQSKPKLIGISAQSKLTKNKRLVDKWIGLIENLKDPSQPQLFVIERYTESDHTDDISNRPQSTVLWLPIHIKGKLTLGLWMELWGDHKENLPPDDLVGMLLHLVMPSYGLAWEKLSEKKTWKKLPIKRSSMVAIGCIALLVIGMIQVPLRVVAPCEIVPLDPIVIRAPMEGIIEEVLVKPGQHVKKGGVLFEYDKRVPLQQLKVAQKEVQILQSEVNRAIATSLESDESEAAKYSILIRKLEKEKIELDLVKYQANQLTAIAPLDGIVIFDNPDEFRGKPVSVGEKILSLSDPHLTKVKIWIPENDNVDIQLDDPIKVILNVDPNADYEAKLIYIASESTLSDKNTPSYIAEAEWTEKQKKIKIGLKGTAIIYGEQVSLWYFFLRKPLAKIRYFLGI